MLPPFVTFKEAVNIIGQLQRLYQRPPTYDPLWWTSKRGYAISHRSNRRTSATLECLKEWTSMPLQELVLVHSMVTLNPTELAPTSPSAPLSSVTQRISTMPTRQYSIPRPTLAIHQRWIEFGGAKFLPLYNRSLTQIKIIRAHQLPSHHHQ